MILSTSSPTEMGTWQPCCITSPCSLVTNDWIRGNHVNSLKICDFDRDGHYCHLKTQLLLAAVHHGEVCGLEEVHRKIEMKQMYSDSEDKTWEEMLPRS